MFVPANEVGDGGESGKLCEPDRDDEPLGQDKARRRQEGIEDGTLRSGRYHGPDGAPEGASYLYFLGDKPKAQAFEQYLAARRGAIDLWLGGHTHTHPDDVLHGRS